VIPLSGFHFNSNFFFTDLKSKFLDWFSEVEKSITGQESRMEPLIFVSQVDQFSPELSSHLNRIETDDALEVCLFTPTIIVIIAINN
jgi:hypothetical protein